MAAVGHSRPYNTAQARPYRVVWRVESQLGYLIECGYDSLMIDAITATKIARAWVAERIDLKPTARPSGAYATFPPDEYVAFHVPPLEGGFRLRGDGYIAIDKPTGTVHDPGYVGE